MILTARRLVIQGQADADAKGKLTQAEYLRRSSFVSEHLLMSRLRKKRLS
jgi:hypothetical protein